MSTILDQSLLIHRATDTGRLRERNEDAVASDASIGLAILADGMGGYNAGDVASQIAILTIAAELKMALHYQPYKNQASTRNLVTETIQLANKAILDVAKSQPQCAGMGTTLVLSLFVDNHVSIAHIGDSRAYLIRDLQLSRLTNDHSVLQEQIDAGLVSTEQAKNATYKNYVTKALGVDPIADIEIHTYPVKKDDIYLLCSDGLTDMLEDSEIATIILEDRTNLSMAANKLIKNANLHGGKDNISVIIIEVKDDFPSQSSSWYGKLVNKVFAKGNHG